MKPRVNLRTTCVALLGRVPPDYAFLLFLGSLVVASYLNQYAKLFTLFPRHIPCESKILANVPDRFAGFDNSAALPAEDGVELVPNLVHFVRVGEGSDMVFAEEAACISAALRTQPGSTVMVHTDREALRGAAWRRLLQRHGGRIVVRRRPRSLHVFGLPYRDQRAEHRVAALRVLMKHGGVYVPNNAYLEADLARFRRLECAAAPTPASDPGVVLAHRDARLLQRWLRLHHDADLDWPRRPAHEPALCRPLQQVLSLESTEAAAQHLHPDDAYLLSGDGSPEESSEP